MFKHLQKSLIALKQNLCLHLKPIVWASQIQQIHHGCSSADRLPPLINNWKLAVIIYNAQQIFVINHKDEYYRALKSRQEAYIKNNDSCKNSTIFSSGSTVAIQMEDGGSWVYGKIIEGNNKGQQGWSYWVQVTKTGRVIMQNTKHIRYTLVTVEQYLWDQLAKAISQTAIFWGTDPKSYHNRYYGPYVQWGSNDGL